MFEYYEKLFPENLRYKPYESDYEHIWDRIKLLDLMIYLYLESEEEQDENSSQENAISKTLMNMESSKKNSYEIEEHKRILSFIKQYINEREEMCQIAKIELSLCTIEKAFNMDEFMKICLTASLAYEMNEKYSKIYAYIHNNNRLDYPTAFIALKLMGISMEEYSIVIKYISEIKYLYEYLFDGKKNEFEDNKAITCRLKLHEDLQKKLIKSETAKDNKKNFYELYEYTQNIKEMHYNVEILNNIKNICGNCKSSALINLNKRSRVIAINGQEGVGKKFCIKHVLKELKRNGLFIDCSVFINDKENFKEIKTDILRKCLIENAVPCFCNVQKLESTDKNPYDLLYDVINTVSQITEIIFLTSYDELNIHNENKNINVIKYTILNGNVQARYEYLQELLLNGKIILKTDIQSLLNKFSFTLGQLDMLVNNIMCIYGIDGNIIKDEENITEVSEKDVYDQCNSLAYSRLSGLGTLVKPVYKMDDLVLKKEQKDILYQACAHVQFKNTVFDKWGFNKKRAYGNGVCVLFCGSPGTGKTMAAQVMADYLHINMYKVDVSQLTSKYIGETEKNIKKLFDEAKKSSMVLFFDEADSIFGKRTEVKDSKDKNANMEAAYLLQKIEEYDGVSILATNYLQNIDEAFIRRISFIVRFSMPEEEERKIIWEKCIPSDMPVEREIDFDFLAAQFPLSGSTIKNIVLNSAFIAASKNEGLNMKNIIDALKLEYLKTNKILLKEDLGPYFNL